jgi:hypothetical protein
MLIMFHLLDAAVIAPLGRKGIRRLNDRSSALALMGRDSSCHQATRQVPYDEFV